MARAVSIDALLKKKFKTMNFQGKWYASFGKPEITGVWIFWGNSGNGKTSFLLQLAKYLTNFTKTKVAYNTLEEGARLSMQRAIERSGIKSVKNKFTLLDREFIDDLKVRLSKPKSPDIIIIDSLQYTDLNKKTYIQLKQEFPKKLFIFISHAEGKLPEGRLAKFIRYDADIKGYIEGYTLYAMSRFGGGEPYIIWQKGADLYNGELN